MKIIPDINLLKVKIHSLYKGDSIMPIYYIAPQYTFVGYFIDNNNRFIVRGVGDNKKFINTLEVPYTTNTHNDVIIDSEFIQIVSNENNTGTTMV